jgi:Leucine-rich repeat (LRR) protein
MRRHNNLSIFEGKHIPRTKTLADIDLRGNSLTYLTPEIFRGLEKLKYLNLGENWISILRSVLQDLHLLYELSMNSNCISSIEPGTFERMFEISVLNMGHQ